MKTANRYAILLAWLFCAWINPGIVWADSATSAFPAAAPEPVAMPAPKAPDVSPPKIVSSAADTGADIRIPDPPKGPMVDKKDLSDAKVPDAVRDVIKNLSNKTGDVTLDDLNAAREAIAKLDALIDIEKRLGDLDKIRNERDKENEKKLAEAIPKSALTPPPSYMPREKTEVTKAAPPSAPPPIELEIIRIEGSNSRYGAVVKDGGTSRLVHAGDHLSDGSVVLSVTTQGVEFERDKTTHLAQIKDVQAVFGDSP